MSLVELVLALVLPMLAGCATLLALGARPRVDPLGFLGTVFPVGALLTALLVFAWMCTGASLVAGGPQIALAIVAAALGAIAWRRRGGDQPEPARPEAPRRGRLAAELFFAAVLVLALGDVLYLVVAKLYEPVVKGDSAAIWTFRAKVLFHHGAIDGSLGDGAVAGAKHPDYPLLNPLLQVWMMSAAGEATDAGLRWPTHLWHLSWVLCVLGATRRRLGPLLGAALAWMYLSMPTIPIVTSGTMMDLTVALAFLGLGDRVLRYVEAPDSSEPNLAIALFWAAILFWSKNEGAMLLAAGLLAALFLPWRRIGWGRLGRQLGFVVVPAAVIALQLLFKRHYGYESPLLRGGTGEEARSLGQMLVENLPVKFGEILAAFAAIAADFHHNRGLFLFYLAALLLGGRAAWSAPTRFLALAIGIGWTGYFLVYVISFYDLTWHLGNSAARTTAQLLGAIVVFLACVLRDVLADVRGDTEPGQNPIRSQAHSHRLSPPES